MWDAYIEAMHSAAFSEKVPVYIASGLTAAANKSGEDTHGPIVLRLYIRFSDLLPGQIAQMTFSSVIETKPHLILRSMLFWFVIP